MKKQLFAVLGFMLSTSTISAKAHIPLEKGIDEQYISSLYQKGEKKIYKGEELKYIAMPIGGIGAGQVNVLGDGSLEFTEYIYNKRQAANNGHGYSTGYQYLHPETKPSRIENSFAISINEAEQIPLSNKGFDAIEFVGEYPIAFIRYKRSENPLPVSISSEVFTPYVPLNLRNSSNPVVILKYTLSNTSEQNITATISGNLKNIIPDFHKKISYKAHVKNMGKLAGIELCTSPLIAGDSTVISHEQFGSLTLAAIDKKAKSIANAEIANITSSIKLKPKQSKEITFMISWYYPNYREKAITKSFIPKKVGHIYNNWYKSSFDVAQWTAQNFEQLYSETKLYHQSYYDNSLPYWLSNRINMSSSVLSAGNVAIFENGRMYAYEGIGFCPGTCAHVFNFVTAISKLFPELERSVRLQQDFNSEMAFSDCGRINFRGIAPNDPHERHSYASDAQSGYVLKAYREHLNSPDGLFLDSIWDKVKLAMGYHIFRDGAEIGLEPNGVLEGKQTFWDPMWYGPNPYNNTLYLAALRAAEEMAKIQGEHTLAQRYHTIYQSGRKFMSEKMWNGEYYVHLYPTGVQPIAQKNAGENGFKSPEEIDANAKRFSEAFANNEPYYYIGTACDAQQLFGQNWANQLGLGDILPAEQLKIAAQSIYKYCWTPDIATIYKYERPKHRVLAAHGEAAMVNGAWPKNKPFAFENTHDKTDAWTGLEFEAACNMINEAELDEALICIKAIDARYDGSKRNPWNQIEGSNFYVRAMHSWNVLLSLSGFTYDGPKGSIGFAPQINTHKYKSFFSTAQGWGTYSQEMNNEKSTFALNLKYGTLSLNEFMIETLKENNELTCYLNNKKINSQTSRKGNKQVFQFEQIQLKAGDVLCIK